MQHNDEFSWIDYPITTGMCVILILVYGCLTILYPSTLALNDDAIYDWGLVNELVFQGEFWRLFTALFVHASVVHLFSNVLFLLIFGLRNEDLFSTNKALSGYFLAGFSGNILSLLWGSSSVSVGASGAVFGIFGMNIMILRYHYRQEMRGVIFFALIFFMLTISQQTNILAHAGGLGAGLILGYLWEGKKSVKHKKPKRKKRMQGSRQRYQR